MPKKSTHTEKLLQAILEQNPGISIEEAWRVYRRKYEQDVELSPKFATKPIQNIRQNHN